MAPAVGLHVESKNLPRFRQVNLTFGNCQRTKMIVAWKKSLSFLRIDAAR